MLFAVASSVGVCYAQIETPAGQSMPAQAGTPDEDDLSKAMSFHQRAVLEQWPELTGTAYVLPASGEQGSVVLKMPYPTEAEINNAVVRALARAEKDFFRSLQERAGTAH
ncbi:MAG: hypothetical protein ACJ74W_22990 [Pyrinomonadaceae bacterium]